MIHLEKVCRFMMIYAIVLCFMTPALRNVGDVENLEAETQLNAEEHATSTQLDGEEHASLTNLDGEEHASTTRPGGEEYAALIQLHREERVTATRLETTPSPESLISELKFFLFKMAISVLISKCIFGGFSDSEEEQETDNLQSAESQVVRPELPQIDVNTFPQKTYGVDTEDEHGQLCCICQMKFERGQRLCSYPQCGHLHHIKCTRDNVAHGNRRCPVCNLHALMEEDEHSYNRQNIDIS